MILKRFERDVSGVDDDGRVLCVCVCVCVCVVGFFVSFVIRLDVSFQRVGNVETGEEERVAGGCCCYCCVKKNGRVFSFISKFHKNLGFKEMSQEDPMVFLRKKREELAVRNTMSILFKFKDTYTHTHIHTFQI